jgi:hypothetical protein
MQFLGGYFHQDWPMEAQSADEILNRYAAHESADLRSAVVAEIAELLRTDECTLSAVLRESGFSYDPSAEGMGVREWLRKVQAVLQTE